MANNRMRLKHKGTEKSILLAKYSSFSDGGMGWTIWNTDLVNEFFDEVQSAAAEDFDWTWGPTDFVLEFEQEGKKGE